MAELPSQYRKRCPSCGVGHSVRDHDAADPDLETGGPVPARADSRGRALARLQAAVHLVLVVLGYLILVAVAALILTAVVRLVVVLGRATLGLPT